MGPANLSCHGLADKAASLGIGVSIGFQPQALNVSVRGGAIVAFAALDFANLHHRGGRISLFFFKLYMTTLSVFNTIGGFEIDFYRIACGRMEKVKLAPR